MPRVPRASDERVGLRPLSNIPAQTQAPSEAFGTGGAAQAFGQEVRGFNKDFQQILIKQKQDADQLAVLDADQKLAAFKLDLQNQAAERRGKDTFGMSEDFGSQFREMAEEIGKDLTDEQQLAFQNRAFGYQTELNGFLEKRTTKERIKFDNERFTARQQTYRNEAKADYENAPLVKNKINSGSAEIMDWASRNGVSNEVRDLKVAEYRSGTHVDLVQAMLNDDREDLVEKHLKTYKDDLLPDDEDSINSLIKKHRTQSEKEKEQQEAESVDDLQRRLYSQAASGSLSISEIDSRHANGELPTNMWKTLRSFTLSNEYDNPNIEPEKKSEVYFDLLKDFADLRGSKVDKKRRILRRASKNDLKTLTDFRTKVLSNKRSLTPRQVQDFIAFTQTNFDNAREGKVSILQSVWNAIRSMPLSPVQVSETMSEAVGRIMPEGNTIQDAQREAEAIKDEQIIKTNPGRRPVGDVYVIEATGQTVKVVGHKANGQNLLEVLE